jgi:hypothetical protein
MEFKLFSDNNGLVSIQSGMTMDEVVADFSRRQLIDLHTECLFFCPVMDPARG